MRSCSGSRRSLKNMNRRRSHLEMLVCALLVAVLAVQPAVGDGKRKGKSASSTSVSANRAKKANGLAQAKVQARAKRSGAKLRAAQNPAPPAVTADPTPTVEPAPDPGETVDPVPGGVAPEEGDPGTPAEMPPAPEEQPAPTPVPPVAEETVPSRNPDPPAESARGSQGDGGSTAPASPSAETPATAALAIAQAPAGSAGQADTAEAGTGRIPLPDTGSTTARRPRASARTTTTAPNAANTPSTPVLPAAETSPLTGTSPLTQAGGATPGSALGSALVTPATEAITRVRPGGPSETSNGPRPRAGDSIPPLQGVASAGASDSSVGEVLVSWAKYALAVLGLLVLALGVNAIMAAARTRRLERQRERLMEDIGLLQAALLPAVPSRLGALLTTVAYRPADGPAAGGDFYDAFALPDGRVGLLLGDVSGHGRQALAKTTLVRFTVRAHLEAGLAPREAIAIAGRSLDGRLSDDFATVIAAIHDPSKGTLTYSSAGHPPPIVVGPSRHVPVTVSSAPPIGVGFSTGQRQTVLPMPEGTSVMIYSDGLLEARIDGVPLGPERLAAWLAELGPDATAKAVLERVVEHADRVPDDLAAVLMHASPGATAPAARIEQLKLDVLDMDGPDLEGFLHAAGVSEVDRLIAGRRVSELLATTSGVIVEVRTGEHPMVSVAPIGDDTGISARANARAT